MPIPAGTRLGAYTVEAPLGAGGMGEVYRARDPRLQRDIALKVLPAIAAADADRRERFQREAHAVAALNHPHIVTIHSVEEADSTVFLTMELVEGRSLADVLTSDGLPVNRVLAIGIAVAQAMSAAHQKGITHRDLKPGNIMLGEGEHAGRIKVLDFGLARVVAPHLVGGAASLPTAAAGAAPITAEGHILGTVAYMSPEQAEGRAVDGRSDVFSLGVVLYEMATGQRPFTGDTNVSVVSSIIKDTPRSVTDIKPTLPRDLARIIRRALAKDPERRYQSAKDLRNDLEDLKASIDSGELATQPPAYQVASSPSLVHSGAPAVRPSSSDAQVAVALVRRHPRTLAAAVVALAVVMVIAVALFNRSAPPASNESTATPEPASLADLRITQLTASGNAERPAISPDGQYVAYVQRDGDASSLWIRQTSTTSHVQIVAAEPGVTLFGATFTPDATSVDFLRQAAGLPAEIWRVPFLGGTPRLLIRDVASSIGWAPDGQRIAFLRSRVIPTLRSQVIVAAPDGGQEQVLTTDAAGPTIVSLIAPWRPTIPPAWSPDGSVIAVVAVNIKEKRTLVLLLDSRSGTTREVTATTREVKFPTGSTNGLFWFNARSLVLNQSVQLGAPNQLFRIAYPDGLMTRVTNDPIDYVGLSFSRDGSLVTGRREARMDIWVGDGGAVAGTEVVQRVPISIERLVWSRDRPFFAAFVGGRPTILSVAPGERAPEEVMADAVTPGVTSDGSTIAFVSASTSDQLDLWTADRNGRRVSKLAPSVTASNVEVMPDDQSVLFTSLTSGTQAIWTVPIRGGTPTKLIDGASVAVSPDGAALAYTTEEPDRRSSLRVCSLPGCTSPRAIGTALYGTATAWTPDGRGVAYANESNVWVQPLSGGVPRQLTRFTDNRPVTSFAWSRDGKRLAIARSTSTHDIVLFKGLK
jgi:serine/threonine protein kinase/Tol biopolymer transport system component